MGVWWRLPSHAGTNRTVVCGDRNIMTMFTFKYCMLQSVITQYTRAGLLTKCTGGLICRKTPVYEVILANFTVVKTDILNFLNPFQ